MSKVEILYLAWFALCCCGRFVDSGCLSFYHILQFDVKFSLQKVKQRSYKDYKQGRIHGHKMRSRLY